MPKLKNSEIYGTFAQLGKEEKKQIKGGGKIL
jgi:hypothetical protein